MRKKCHYICFRNGTQNDEILLMKTRKTLTKNNKETFVQNFFINRILNILIICMLARSVTAEDFRKP